MDSRLVYGRLRMTIAEISRMSRYRQSFADHGWQESAGDNSSTPCYLLGDEDPE